MRARGKTSRLELRHPRLAVVPRSSASGDAGAYDPYAVLGVKADADAGEARAHNGKQMLYKGGR